MLEQFLVLLIILFFIRILFEIVRISNRSTKFDKIQFEKQEKNYSYDSDGVYYQKKDKLISQNELRFYWALKKALVSRKGLMINCQTPILSLLRTNDESSLRKIWSKRVDFIITNSKFETLAVIELDDSSHLKPDRIERDQFVNKILKEHHNLVRFSSSKYYNSEDIKQNLRCTKNRTPAKQGVTKQGGAQKIERQRSKALQSKALHKNRTPAKQSVTKQSVAQK